MLHGIDARTGFEVWAFVPYNLLPKLRTLMDGQPVDQFDYFVDSSPKVAEVEVNGNWRTILVIGQGAGGTFYQAFDVTEAGMGGPPPASNDYNGVLASFSNPNRVKFMWSFPRYSQFDPNVFASIPVGDGTAGGRVRFYGDLKASASLAEKTVGFTWLDPAVGPLNQDRTVNAVMTGSGYFPGVESQLPGRGPGAPRAGHYLYLINVADGQLLGNAAGGDCSGAGCLGVGIVSNDIKNAIQADVAAASAVTKAYVGDLNGRYWRFDFNDAGGISSTLMAAVNQPIYSSSALLSVGSSDQYMFFSTGSDLLPATAGGATGTFKLFGLKDDFPGAGATVKFSYDLALVTNSGGLTTGERPSSSPSVAGNIVFYTTTSEDASQPCADFSANLYAFTFLGGAAYDTNNSGSVTGGEKPKIKTVAGRATAPFIVDQHVFFGTSGENGASVEMFGDPEDFNNGVGQVGVRLLSWRENCPRCRQPLQGSIELLPAPRLSRSAAVIWVTILVTLIFVVGLRIWQRRAIPEIVLAVAPISPEGATSIEPRVTTPGEDGHTDGRLPFLNAGRAGNLAYSRGNYEEALDRYEEATVKHLEDAESHSNLGQVLVRLGRSEEALLHFELAIRLNPDRWAYHFNRAYALGELDRWRQAIDEYREARRLFPIDYATQYNLARALHKHGNEKAAVQEYQRAIRLAPGEPSFHLSLAISYEQLQQLDEAAETYEHYLELAPDAGNAEQVRTQIVQLRATKEHNS